MGIGAEWAGVVGALIGAGSSLASTALAHWLKERKADSLQAKRAATLRRMLNDPRYTWRSIDNLAVSIGADEDLTKELLIGIDARASLSNPRSWALVSRAPWPDEIQPAK